MFNILNLIVRIFFIGNFKREKYIKNHFKKLRLHYIEIKNVNFFFLKNLGEKFFQKEIIFLAQHGYSKETIGGHIHK